MRTLTRRCAVLGATLTGAVGVSLAEDVPMFRHGLWQFDRTVNGQRLETRECISPTEALKRQNALLTRSGCKFTPTERSGNVYRFTAECTVNTPGAASVTARSTSVMTVDSDSGYTVEITTTGAGTTTEEQLTARRVGDCPR